MKEYPSDVELERIRGWPCPDTGDWKPLMELIEDIWQYAPDWGWHEESSPTPGHLGYHISTGGWSGNEDIISAMQDNAMFWLMCWEESRRGGHFTFRVRPFPSPEEKVSDAVS